MELGPISKRDMYGDELGEIAEKMNLIHGVRVGEEARGKYRDHLIEMVTNGFLTDEEYVARMEWVDAVRTEHELQIALMDLPRMPLTERPEPKKTKPTGAVYFLARSPYWSGAVAGFEWVLFIVGLVIGAPITIAIAGTFGVLWTLLTVKRYNDEKEYR